MVTDANGRTAETSTDFMVDIPGPSVAIHAPAAGQMYDISKPVVTGEFSGIAAPVTLSLMLDGKAVGAIVNGNEFTYTPADALDDGEYTLVAVATDANNKTAEATAIFMIRLPVPTVSIQSPHAGQIYDHGKPVIDGSFSGADPIKVELSIDGKNVEAKVNDNNQFTYTPADALSDGGHTIAVKVTDANGRTAETSSVFTVNIPGPTVAILSPAPGQTYEHGETVVVRSEFSGMTDVNVTTFTLNGEDVELGEDAVEDNLLTYTPDPTLGTDEHTVFVEVTDENGKTAQATVVFNVKLDSTPPVISEVAPSGILKDGWVNISVVVGDEQSDVTSVRFYISDEATFVPLGDAISGARSSADPQQIANSNIQMQGDFAPGTHTLRVAATSAGGTTTHTWSFTVVLDNIKPTITSISPSGTIHAGLPTISASAHDESGVEAITITVMNSIGKVVEGKMQNDKEDKIAGITRSDFRPDAPLSEGTYSIEVRATDTFGNSSTAKGGFTIDFDTAAPLITSSSPQNGARLMYEHDEEKKPTISITFGDAETGINVDSIRFVFNDKLINLTPEQKSVTQVLYQPPADLEPGQYTVKLEVSDNAHLQGNVWDDGAREANMSVYEFSFFVEHGDVPILKAAPFNYPNPFTDNTRISFVLARRSNVSITIYDATLRPVRTLVDNEVMEAGYYTRAADGSGSNAIGWDGKSSSGEDLARGIYFCQIMVTDGFEPEYAILKLALTR